MNCNWKYALGLLFVAFTFVTILAVILSGGESGSGNGITGDSETAKGTFGIGGGAGGGRRAASTTTNLGYSAREVRANSYVRKLSTELLQECERHSGIVLSHKLHSSDINNGNVNVSSKNSTTISASMQVYLDSLVHNHRYVSVLLQNAAELDELRTGWESYQNETLKSLVHRILVSAAATADDEESQSGVNSDWARLARFEELYRQKIVRVVVPLLGLISDYEYEEERQGGPTASTYHARVELNKKIWIQFHNQQGQFVREQIYPEAVKILRRELYGKPRPAKGYGVDLGTAQTVSAVAAAAEEEFTTFRSYYHSMQTELDGILAKILPLYKLLHGYIRGTSLEIQKIAAALPGQPQPLIAANGSLPLHFISAFGNWFNYKDDGAPFDQIQVGHISYNIMYKELSARQLLEHVNRLFLSLNLTTGDDKGLPASFWDSSLLVERSVHNDSGEFESACDGVLDVCRADDYKAVLCDGVTYENFRDFHIKLGTIKYEMMAQPPGLPLPGRGINPILLHANGVLWNLLAASPRYIDSLSLWQHVDWPRKESLPDDITSTLNFQYTQALAILPRMVEFISRQKWLASVLARGSNSNNNVSSSNCDYWRWREEFEGVQPPEIRRSSQLDGFRGLKNLRKSYEEFIGEIIGFQLHKAVCEAAGEFTTLTPPGGVYKPLQQCDISNSSEASKLLIGFMSADTTKPLRDVLYQVTGSDQLSVEPMLDYFEPLYHFLSSNNYKSKFPLGWDNKMNNYPSCI